MKREYPAHLSMIDTAGVIPAPVHTSTTVSIEYSSIESGSTQRRGRKVAVFVACARNITSTANATGRDVLLFLTLAWHVVLSAVIRRP